MNNASIIPYHRVIPRDLFNEAKFLKSLGQLSLKVHDGLLPGAKDFCKSTYSISHSFIE